MRTELAAFRIRYRHEVGLLHDELDELEYAIAEAELGEISKRVASEVPGSNPPPANPKPETAPRFTSDAIRRLFRDVAKAIHPDLSRDTDARDRRHALMIEANRAYAQGDEERLRTILQSWERSPEASRASMRAPSGYGSCGGSPRSRNNSRRARASWRNSATHRSGS